MKTFGSTEEILYYDNREGLVVINNHQANLT